MIKTVAIATVNIHTDNLKNNKYCNKYKSTLYLYDFLHANKNYVNIVCFFEC